MIDLEDILNLLFPGLDDGFIIFVVIILIVAGISKLFKHKEKPQSDSETETNLEKTYDTIYEYKKGEIVAEALPLSLFLTDDSKYISFTSTTTPAKAKIVADEKERKKNNSSKYIVYANNDHNGYENIFKSLGIPSSPLPEGILRTTYKGEKREISCYLKNITIEILRQRKEEFVVCASKGIPTEYTLKNKIDVINSKSNYI